MIYKLYSCSNLTPERKKRYFPFLPHRGQPQGTGGGRRGPGAEDAQFWLLFADCKNSESYQDSMKTTYSDVLSGFESADVVGVVAVVHLPQDSDHARHKTALEEKENANPHS